MRVPFRIKYIFEIMSLSEVYHIEKVESGEFFQMNAVCKKRCFLKIESIAFLCLLHSKF